MQKAQNGKKRWWIPVAVAAVLAVAGICLALFLRPADVEPGQSAPVDQTAAELYWNIDGRDYMENSESGLTSREPDVG